ncbi:ATP-binding protein [Bradyrhizobium ivorense]|uniref:ATP-binding protein n=1 Tax=Bradyrhizobium ivorense TaxID=2511166 RepID=UPI00155A7EF6|nr:adenylate/guanylate cyclase domain-containing protein [Bradyrhizobium ivorense]
MFADVKGSTEIVSHSDPERASEWLERIIDLMRIAVHRFGGTVNRAQGDGIMALFGAPVECEDHAVRACGAALAMLDSVNRHALAPGPALQIRIGIASGEVMTLPVSSDAGINYDAMGGVVHLAARLEQAAAPGSALVSADTRQGVRTVFETQGVELTGLRGLPAIVPAFELLRWNSQRGAPSIRVDGSQAIFVDREKPISTLRSMLNSLTQKRGRTVFISGEAGVGKSRLINEFLEHERDNIRVCVSNCSPYRSFAYGPLADLVADLTGIDADASPEMRKTRLAALKARDPHLVTGNDEELGTLLDVDSSSSELLSLSPIGRRLRVEAAAVLLFASISQERPLILIVEDIHWLDIDDLSQLARFCEKMRNSQCLVLLTARDEFDGASALIEQSDYHCNLQPLESEDVLHLLNALLRSGRGTSALTREILERTRGNPLFIEETLHALHQIGALAREAHVYDLHRPGVDIPLPLTVRGLLAARIDRLEDTEKSILQAVAVVGRSATPSLLRSLLDLDVSVISGAIERLIALDLLAADLPQQRSAAMNLEFRHPLVREVAYEQTLLRTRTRIHRWMLSKLEDEEPSGLRDRADILAEHAFRAEAWQKAARYMLRAGNEAFRRDAKTEAVRFLLRGLEAVERAGQNSSDAPISLQLRLELRNPLFQLARMDELADHLAAARPLALSLNDPVHTGRYHIYQSHYFWFAGDSANALREAEAARKVAVATSLDALAVRAQFQQGLIQFSCAEHRDAIELMDDVSAAIREPQSQNEFGVNRSLLVTTLGYSARAHAELGQIARAREDAARSLAVARDLNNKFEWVFAYVAEGWVNFRAEDLERALPFLERACELCATEDVPLMGPVANSFLSLTLLEMANEAPNPSLHKRALMLAEKSVKQGEQFRFGAFQPMRLAILSHALRANGLPKESRSTALKALETARLQVEPVSEVEALLALSLSQYSLEASGKDALQDAWKIAEERQMIPTLTRCKRIESRFEGSVLPA